MGSTRTPQQKGQSSSATPKKFSREDLKNLYLWFNKKYFSNKCPKNLKVKFGKLPQNAFGVTKYEGREPFEIVIDLNPMWSSAIAGTLLHEMVHVYLPYRCGHGKVFQAEMLRLAKQGAFKDIW